MKYIEKTKSKRGHGKSDFIIQISDSELKVLKLILRKVPPVVFEKKDGKEVNKNSYKSLLKVLVLIK